MSELSKPILSICIPTFNRSDCLRELLFNSEKIIKTHGDIVEICISNNASTDSTEELVHEFCERFPINYVCKSENVGSTLNTIDVCKQANGIYRLIIGDDDLLDLNEFNNLINLIKKIKDDERKYWILFNPYKYKKIKNNCVLFLNKIWRIKLFNIIHGYSSISFMGKHALHYSFLDKIMVNDYYYGWPHLALYDYSLSNSRNFKVMVYPVDVVLQNPRDTPIFWKPFDLFKISYNRVLFTYFFNFSKNPIYTILLITRELYSPILIGVFFLSTFDKPRKSLGDLVQILFLNKPLLIKIISFPLLIALALLNFIDKNLILRTMPKRASNKIKSILHHQNVSPKEYDGIARKL